MLKDSHGICSSWPFSGGSQDPLIFLQWPRAALALGLPPEAKMDQPTAMALRLRAWRKKNGRHPSTAAWDANNPEKRRAQKTVENHLKARKIARQPCERCGAEKVHAHHDDYSKPLDVMWLCPKHHKERHRELDEFRGGVLRNRAGGSGKCQ